MNKNLKFQQNPLMKNLNSILQKQKYSIKTDTKTCTHESIGSKTFFLFFLTFVASLISCCVTQNYYQAQKWTELSALVYIAFALSGLFSFILVIASNFVPVSLVKYIAIFYSLCDGFVLGVLLFFLQIKWPGFIYDFLLALLSTIMLFAIMHYLYSSKKIKYSKKLSVFVFCSFLAILISHIIMVIYMHFMGISFEYLWIGLFLSIFAVCIGCLSLVQDFHHIDHMVTGQLPKEYEWKAAFALHLTLMYIFYNILRIIIYILSLTDRK